MELLYFILGILFIKYIAPILDGFISWFAAYLEVVGAQYSEAVNLIDIRMHQASENANKNSSKQAIGFDVSFMEQQEEDDYEDI